MILKRDGTVSFCSRTAAGCNINDKSKTNNGVGCHTWVVFKGNMDYIKKDLGSYNLHMINTEKFKTITVKVVFHTPIIKQEITKRNVLADVLLQSSKKYNSKRDLIIAAEELYSVDIANNNQRLGNYILTSFNFQVLMDKYTEEGNLEKSIEERNGMQQCQIEKI